MNKKDLSLLIICGIIIPILFTVGCYFVGFNYVYTAGNTESSFFTKDISEYASKVAEFSTIILVILYLLNISIYKFAEVEGKKYLVITSIAHILCLGALLGYFLIKL